MNKGLYRTRIAFQGKAGKTYRLGIENVDVNHDGRLETYHAESYLPPVNPIDSITLKYTRYSFASGWEVKIWAWDPAGVKNYYAFKALKNGILLTNRLSEYVVQSDDLFDGNFTYGITAQFLNDENATEKAYPGDTITLEINGLTYDYYRFIHGGPGRILWEQSAFFRATGKYHRKYFRKGARFFCGVFRLESQCHRSVLFFRTIDQF